MSFLSKWEPQLLSVLRIVVGLLFLEHGMSKIFHFPVAAMPGPLPPMILAAGIIELVGGALLVLGLFTRIAAFIASGEMAAAYWLVHVHMGSYIFPVINKGDLAILFCFVFLFIAAAGAGPWSIDAAMKKS